MTSHKQLTHNLVPGQDVLERVGEHLATKNGTNGVKKLTRTDRKFKIGIRVKDNRKIKNEP